MAQHTRPEILRHVQATVSEEMPTCHLCSWAWRAGAFTVKRPSQACLQHRSLFSDDTPPAPGLLIPLPRAG